MHEFVYENPGTDAAVFDSRSPKQLPPKVAKKVLTDYEKQELRNQKACERHMKKAAEKAAEDGESEGDRGDVSSVRKWSGRGRDMQLKKQVASSALSTDEDNNEPLVKFPVCFFIDGPRPYSLAGSFGCQHSPTCYHQRPFFPHIQCLILEASVQHCTAYPMQC